MDHLAAAAGRDHPSWSRCCCCWVSDSSWRSPWRSWCVGAAHSARRPTGRPGDRATYETLHQAALAARSLREGLTPAGASRSVRHLRALLDAAMPVWPL